MSYGKTVGAASRNAGALDAASRLDAAAVGVFAWRTPGGRARACAVTPFVVGDDAVVTSTLALLGKVVAVRRDARTALLAGGLLLRGNAEVQVDASAATFDAVLRAQERRKFPSSRALLALPLHRRLLWWYVGRALLRLPLALARRTDGDDAATLVRIGDDGCPEIHPLRGGAASWEKAEAGDAAATDVACDDGEALVLLHRENAAMTVLAQRTLRGRVVDGRFHVESCEGSLAMQEPSLLAQVAELRRLSSLAHRNRGLLDAWPRDSRRSAGDFHG